MVTWFESLGYMYPEFVTSLVALGEVIAGIGVIVGGFFSNHIGNLTTRLSGGGHRSDYDRGACDSTC